MLSPCLFNFYAQYIMRLQRIIRDSYEQLFGNKMDNLEEMDRFLEKFNFPRLNQEEIEIMNNPITSTQIETVIKKISQKTKAQNQMATQENSIKNLRRANAYPSKTLSKNCRGTLPNSFYEATITLYQNQTKKTQKRK